MPTKKVRDLMGFILLSLVCPWLGNEVYAKMGSHITTKARNDENDYANSTSED
jgi:hypothetical protein